jgi:glycosyltransferase involved in cell wall biosynthesis
MRILVDARPLNDPNPSGVGGYTDEIITALLKHQDAPDTTLYTSGARRPDLSRYGHARHLHVHAPNKILSLSHILFHAPRIPKTFDLIFLPNLAITSLPPGLPYVIMIHDVSWKIFPEFYSKKMQLWHAATRPRHLVENAQAVIVPSASTKQDVSSFFRVAPGRIHVIPHGVHERFSPNVADSDLDSRLRLRLPAKFALFVGTIEPRKNLLAAIGAVKAYRDQTKDDLHFVVAGKKGWKSASVLALLSDPHCVPWLHDLGYVSRADLPALYRAATVFLWPSIYEGFGLPILEAMACGTPVITSHTSAMPEVAGDAAILVDPYNPADTTMALREVIGSPNLCERMKTKGLEQARNFSWEKTTGQLVDILKAVQTRNT